MRTDMKTDDAIIIRLLILTIKNAVELVAVKVWWKSPGIQDREIARNWKHKEYDKNKY